jgi:hypothetical protein
MGRFAKRACLQLFTIVFFIHLLVVFTNTVRAETFGSKNISSWCYGWRDQQVNQIRFDLKVWDQEDSKMTIACASVSDTGRTFTVASGSPQFSAMVSWLTNGSENELVLFALGPDGSGGGDIFSEASIQKLYGNGPDFAGYEIKSISMTLNNLVLEYPVTIPHLPEYGQVWNHMEYDVTLSFNGGSVPEPGTILLLGLGAVTARKKVKRKR